MEKTNQKKYILGILLIGAFPLITGVTYALWSMTLTQETTNVITTGCFRIEFMDENPINLQSAYPIRDEEANNLTPYTFTITNTCESYATYQINLEILNTTTLNHFEYIATSLNKKSPSVLTNFEEVQPTLHEAIRSYKLETGYFDKNETKTFTLRIWLDESTPAIEEVMNKVLESKITIITSFLPESPSFSEVITHCSKNGYNTTDCMLENSKYDTVNLAYDETVDNNLRYIGANPNNYVWFNDELWRIIGVMNNVEDSNGNATARIKLVRDEPIGEYSWDTSSFNINEGQGINEWSQADIMKLLNPGYEDEDVGGSLYWNRKEGKCYNWENNANTLCDFTSLGLSSEAKSLIEEVFWPIGSNGTEISYDNILTNKFYELERSNNTGKLCTGGSWCNDTVERTTSWKGFIGLITPSDYGYATSGGSNTDRSTCLNTILYNWSNSTVSDCSHQNWLYKANHNQWTMIPLAVSSYSLNVFVLNSTGNIGGYGYLKRVLSPVLFLNSNVIITSGIGSQKEPFQLSEI